MNTDPSFFLKVMLFFFLMGSTVSIYGQDLDKHLWEHRLLFIKTTETSSQKHQEQLNEFTSSETALSDRQFVFYIIKRNEYKEINYTDKALSTSGKISEKVKNQLLDPAKHFEIILIGLDGSIKLQQTEILKKQDLFNRIDAMPLRRYELKKKG